MLTRMPGRFLCFSHLHFFGTLSQLSLSLSRSLLRSGAPAAEGHGLSALRVREVREDGLQREDQIRIRLASGSRQTSEREGARERDTDWSGRTLRAAELVLGVWFQFPHPKQLGRRVGGEGRG